MNNNIVSGPPIKNPIPIQTLGELFFESAQKYSDKTLLIDVEHDKSETFKSVSRRSVRVALELQKRGITSEDTIAFCSSNTLDQTVPVLAAIYLGSKVTNLDTRLSAQQTTHLLSLVSPKIIFADESSVPLIESSLGNLKSEIVVCGNSKKYATLADFLKIKENEEKFRPKKGDVDDTIFMFFSSGTTGLPKAVCHSHRSFLLQINMLREVGWNVDVFLCYSTYYWISGLMFLGLIFVNGGCRLLVNGAATAKGVFEIIQKYKVTYAFLTPMVVYDLSSFEHARDYDTSSLEVLCTGGGIFKPDLAKNITTNLKHTTIANIYGMTEVGGICGFNPHSDRDYVHSKIASVGTPISGSSIKVVDLEDENKNLGPNEKGEIRLKSLSAMKGYYKLSTAGVFDPDGFIKTGDIGYYDEDGCIYVSGRIKEMFKYYNWQISPTNIESVLMGHPAVLETVVYGVPVNEGDMPAALVVLRDGVQVTEKEVEEFVDKKVSEKERLIGGVRFVKSLPRTPTGKIVRKDIANSVIYC